MKIRKFYNPKEINLYLLEPFLNDLEKKISLNCKLYGAKLNYGHEIEYDNFVDFNSELRKEEFPKEAGVSAFFYKNKRPKENEGFELSLFIDVRKDRIVLSVEGEKERIKLIETNFVDQFGLSEKIEIKKEEIVLETRREKEFNSTDKTNVKKNNLKIISFIKFICRSVAFIAGILTILSLLGWLDGFLVFVGLK